MSLPILIVKPGSMSRRDIRRAEKFGGICVIENKEPADARFLEPPLKAQMEANAFACMTVMRMVINHTDPSFTRGTLTKWFVDCLLKQPKLQTVEAVKGKS